MDEARALPGWRRRTPQYTLYGGGVGAFYGFLAAIVKRQPKIPHITNAGTAMAMTSFCYFATKEAVAWGRGRDLDAPSGDTGGDDATNNAAAGALSGALVAPLLLGPRFLPTKLLLGSLGGAAAGGGGFFAHARYAAWKARVADGIRADRRRAREGGGPDRPPKFNDARKQDGGAVAARRPKTAFVGSGIKDGGGEQWQRQQEKEKAGGGGFDFPEWFPVRRLSPEEARQAKEEARARAARERERQQRAAAMVAAQQQADEERRQR